MADKNLNINIVAKDKSKQALNNVQGSLNKTKTSVLNLRNALIGIGAGAILKSFIDVGKEVENLQVRFKFLFGSVKEGQIAFDNLSKFASRVPFSLEEITAASGNLAVVSKDANDLTRILEITGNVAAVTGLDFATAGSQIQRAFSGGIAAADIFREKGVRSLLGFKEGAKVSIDETVEAFEQAFSGDGRFANATDDLAQTLTGTVSMLQDKLFNFQKLVSDQFIGQLTNELGDLNGFLEENNKITEELAETLGTALAKSAIAAGEAIIFLKDSMSALTSVQKEVDEFLNIFNSSIVGILTGTNGLKHLSEELDETDEIMKRISVSTDHLSHNFKEASKSLDENSESLSKNQELARAMQQFAIRNSEIMKTINHAEIERMKKLDEEVERAFKRQEARNKRKVQLEKDAQREIVSATETGLSALSGLNKTAFRAYQAFQAGMTIINTYRAISNALATYPPPLNLAVAAAQGAAGFAQVAAIRSQSFSARQTGGAVVEGQPYMVGEAGREMFVPSTNGNIVPNDQLGGSTTVNFNITTVDAKGFNELLTNSRGTIVGMINSAVNEQGRASLV
tara:strand:- start:2127 stop:3836 length:1710 start_codon:yes stop_codon:yes gene_type:complete